MFAFADHLANNSNHYRKEARHNGKKQSTCPCQDKIS